MKGLYFIRRADLNQQPAHPQMDALKLLAKQGNLEIMYQRILKGASVWLTPMQREEDIEFFYVCQGSVCFTGANQRVELHAGDTFHTHGLEQEVVLDILADTDLLYISTMPIFDESANYQTELMQLLRQIDEKDHYTLQHSVNVRNYSIQLWQALPHRQTGSFGDVVLASLFHDVGKVAIPDEILKKPSRCTPEEYEIIKTHPQSTGELLSKRFQGNVVLYAAQHHERLDGSGYPLHLTAKDISFESRVIALADAFDAMTTSRGYNVPKGYEEAALELCSLPMFDREVADALLQIIREGKLISNTPVELE